MNPLLKKEIRLVLPAWVAVLLLEMSMPWFFKQADQAVGFMPTFIFFGMVLLAVDSFGREFSLGTFSSLMSQPVERRLIWRTKIAVLLAAAALIFTAFYASCDLRMHISMTTSGWRAHPKYLVDDFGRATVACVVVLFVALTGGLWTALLLRQVSAAFWITCLVPAGLFILIIFILSAFFKSASDAFGYGVIYGTAGIYIAIAFWLAHRLFCRAEDSGWTGGVISFSRWRYFERAAPAGISRRQPGSLAALLKKEWQLQGVTLFAAAVLLGLHCAVFFLRITYVTSHPSSLAAFVSDGYWCFWMVIPLVIGCLTVAEERKLGVADSQFGLPVSRRRQFAIKLISTLIFGVLLGGVLPYVLETLAAHLGAPCATFKPENFPPTEFFGGPAMFQICILTLASALAGVGFFASTLAKNFLQALSIAILSIIACVFFGFFINYLLEEHVSLFGLMPIPWALLCLMAIPSLFATLLWLGYRNFNYWHETGRLWRRNLAGLLGVLVFTLAGSILIYNRVWEVVIPAEPAHGPAQLSLANPPAFVNKVIVNDLQVRLPDGRVWYDSLAYLVWWNQENPWKRLWWKLSPPLPESAGPRAFMGGSNWVSTVATGIPLESWGGVGRTVLQNGYLDTVGIQPDGTLWISSESKSNAWTGTQMTQFGSETNWRWVVRWGHSALLLKADGTLWQWGQAHDDWNQSSTNWPSLRTFQPRQIGTAADWQALASDWIDYATKKDGSIWRFYPGERTGEIEFDRLTNSLSTVFVLDRMAYVAPAGALWVMGSASGGTPGQPRAYVQVGQETNWVSVAMSNEQLVALKTDGSLWQWNLSYGEHVADAVKQPPTPLSTHHDWVALIIADAGSISLAADGSLWYWPGHFRFQSGQAESPDLPTLLKPSLRPELLGNIFAAN